MERLERSLQLHFATLTALGGLLMISGEVGAILPTIAVVAAIVAFLTVDVWKIFYLPTSAAYLGMGAVAIFCMVEFLWIRPEAQLTVVAQLLVLVEAVLLFQRKTIRVFEQIGVFCLLELVVAAVFNSALLFGLLLIPFSVVGLRGLVLLQSLATAQASAAKAGWGIHTSASDSMRAVAARSTTLPRATMAWVAPAVVLIAAMFFYALPRASGEAGMTPVGGRITTGFSDTMTLDQVGKLFQNEDLVMRLSMTDQQTGVPYRAREPIYLRGQVLDKYDDQHGIGYWRALQLPPTAESAPLPPPYDPPQNDHQRSYDRVEVRVDLQPLSDKSLFAIAPYHGVRSTPRVEHLSGQWLLALHEPQDVWSPERLRYRFATHAFRHGRQTPFLRYFGPDEQATHDAVQRRRNRRRGPSPYGGLTVWRRMLQFDSLRMPTVASEASRIAAGVSERDHFPYWLSRAIEEHLSTTGGFNYTLELTGERDYQMDPIEQFVAQDRRGHCQYFASAMVMMLRSQRIPARVVVGYKTDEYNPLGQHYLVRQLHAHAWVEALVEEDDIPEWLQPVGQPSNGPMLVRFDPTPRRARVNTEVSSVGKLYDFAQSLWSHYVLDMDGERQNETLFGGHGNHEMVGAYANMLNHLRQMASRIDGGPLGAWAVARHHLFSWRAAVGGMAAMLILLVLFRMGLPSGLRGLWRSRRPPQPDTQASPVAFYQRLCDLLAKAELRRAEGQTPLEFADQAATRLATRRHGTPVVANPTAAPADPVQTLVALFYRVRYGGVDSLDAGETEIVDRSLEQIEDMVHRATHGDAHSERS